MPVGRAARSGNAGIWPEHGPGRGGDRACADREPGPEHVGDRPQDGVRQVRELGQEQQPGAHDTGIEQPVDLAELVHVAGERQRGGHRASGGQHGQRASRAGQHRPHPRGHQRAELSPRRQCPGRAEAGRDERDDERRDQRLRHRRGRQSRPAADGQRPGQRGVRHGHGEPGREHLPQLGDAVPADHGATSPPEQRARQRDQAKRQHADPARPADLHRDMMTDQPEHGGGAHHADQAQPGMGRGDPAGQHQDGQHGQTDSRGRAGCRGASGEQPPGPVWPAAAVRVRTALARGSGTEGRCRHKTQPSQSPTHSRRRRAGPRSGYCRGPRSAAGQRACMSSLTSRAVSLGVRPTLTPTFSSASFFACAVPAEPEMIAPACPIVLPSGAVNPAT